MKEEELTKITKAIESLISELDVGAGVKILCEPEGETEAVVIQIESPNPALLIGYHGETLGALQTLSSFFVHQATGRWIKALVNVGDYRQKREEQLHHLALNLAMRAKFSKEPQTVTNLTAGERRIIHLFLADHPDVCTESEGEGKERQLLIKPRK